MPGHKDTKYVTIIQLLLVIRYHSRPASSSCPAFSSCSASSSSYPPSSSYTVSSSCPPSSSCLPVIQLLPDIKLPLLASSSCPISNSCPPLISYLPNFQLLLSRFLLCPGFSFSSRLIVLVEVARIEEVDLSGKVVLVFLTIEVGAIKTVPGSCNQCGFSAVPSRRGAVNVGSKVCQAVESSGDGSKIWRW
jgi:hypothetical protein